MFVLLKFRKTTFKTILSLILANKKASWRNEMLFSLFYIEQSDMTILNVFRLDLLIFFILTLKFLVQRSSFMI